jgi:predicted amidohydrolase
LAKVAGEFGFYLICGMVERDSRSKRIFDSAVMVNPSGDFVGVYRKIHLWAMERRFFTPGKGFPVFKTKFGKVGIGICYDLEFPEPARAMALQGADVIFFSSAQPSPMENLVDTYIRSRAAENGVFVAHSNRVGREGGTVFFGQSQIVSPDGRVLTRKHRGQRVVVARVDFRISRRMRMSLPYLQHRVTETYSALTWRS